MTPETSLSRREILSRCTYGVGMLGLSTVLQAESFGATASSNPVAPIASHFPPRAKRIIHLWMNGGPSQVDSFDPKPGFEEIRRATAREHGQAEYRTKDVRANAFAV